MYGNEHQVLCPPSMHINEMDEMEFKAHLTSGRCYSLLIQNKCHPISSCVNEISVIKYLCGSIIKIVTNKYKTNNVVTELHVLP